jgi:hypothetical protein
VLRNGKLENRIKNLKVEYRNANPNWHEST